MALKIKLGSVYNINDYDELARMFLPRGSYELIYEQASVFEGVPEKLKKAREMYAVLSNETGKTLPWGILTGVKPTKLYTQLVHGALDLNHGAPRDFSTICDRDDANLRGNPGCAPQETERRDAKASAEAVLKDVYLVSTQKIALLRQVYEQEQCVLLNTYYGNSNNSVALYVGIPFCPTRCEYCTFTAGVGNEKQMRAYLDALLKEISFVSKGMKGRGMNAESVYIGGGTPTSLPVSMLEELLNTIKESFVTEDTEFTVEAGRPDSITYEKTGCIARAAGRISINPQTMNDKTLESIGRKHKVKDVINAFDIVRATGIPVINSDIIAGLPGESLKDFEYTLEEILKLKPENLTIHTLALKKGAFLREKDPLYNYKQTGTAEEMINAANEILAQTEMKPYYLYRQKQTVDNLENTGYAVPGSECLYNMRMMQEKQTVIALGAGAVSRHYFPAEDRIERIFNVADTNLYIGRIDEMLKRKSRLFF